VGKWVSSTSILFIINNSKNSHKVSRLHQGYFEGGVLVPLIIIGLVAPAIAEIGREASKLLMLTVGLAYADTIVAGLLAFFAGSIWYGLYEHTDPEEGLLGIP